MITPLVRQERDWVRSKTSIGGTCILACASYPQFGKIVTHEGSQNCLRFSYDLGWVFGVGSVGWQRHVKQARACSARTNAAWLTALIMQLHIWLERQPYHPWWNYASSFSGCKRRTHV